MRQGCVARHHAVARAQVILVDHDRDPDLMRIG